MSNKFLGGAGFDIGVLQNGSVDAFFSTVGSLNLNSSLPVKTNASSRLISTLLAISDTAGLQSILDSKISNPITTTLSLGDNEISNTTAVGYKIIPTPSLPPSGYKKTYVNDADGLLHLIDSKGADSAVGGGDVRFTGTPPTVIGEIVLYNSTDGQQIKESGTTLTALNSTIADKLPLAGGTMTGSIDLSHNEISNIGILSNNSGSILVTSGGTSNIFIDTGSTIFQKDVAINDGASITTNIDLKSHIGSTSDRFGEVHSQSFYGDIFDNESKGVISIGTNNSLQLSLCRPGGTIIHNSDTIMSGNTLHGSTAVGGNLSLSSTTNASKGQIICLDNLSMSNKTIANCAIVTHTGSLTLRGFSSNNLVCDNTLTTVSKNLSLGSGVSIFPTVTGVSDLGSASFKFNDIFTTKITSDIMNSSGVGLNMFGAITMAAGKNIIMSSSNINLNGNSSIINGVSVLSNSFDKATPAGTLTVGPTNSTLIQLSQPGITTQVRGPLQADQGSTIRGFNATFRYYTMTNTVSVNNTTTETSLFDDTKAIGTRTASANFYQVGDCIRLLVSGYLTTSGNQNITIRLKLNGVVVVNTGAVMVNAGAAEYFRAAVDVVIITTGSGGTCRIAGNFIQNSGNYNLLSTSTVAINTTTSNTWDLSAQWTTALTSNDIVSTIGILDC